MYSTWTVDPTEGVRGEEGVHDGDTFHVVGELRQRVEELFDGLNYDMAMVVREKVRLALCNAPEMNTADGKAARIAVKQWLTAQPFTMRGYGRDKYGRWLADAIRLADGKTLSGYVLAMPGSVPMTLVPLGGSLFEQVSAARNHGQTGP